MDYVVDTFDNNANVVVVHDVQGSVDTSDWSLQKVIMMGASKIAVPAGGPESDRNRC